MSVSRPLPGPKSELSAPLVFSERLHLLVWAYLDEQEADGTRSVVADRVVKATNGAMWRDLSSRWSVGTCTRLAALASDLEAGPLVGPLGRKVAGLTREIGLATWEARQVDWIVAAASAGPVRDPRGAAAAVIRAFGLSVCVEHDMAARCPCLIDGRTSAGWPEPPQGKSRPDTPPPLATSTSLPGARNDGETNSAIDSEAQAFFDSLVEAMLKGTRSATISLGLDVVNEALARELDTRSDGSVVGALNDLASALEALGDGMQVGVRKVAGFVIRRSGLPPWVEHFGGRLAASLVSLPIDTQLQVTALGLRVFGACLQVELTSLDGSVPPGEIVDDPRVRPALEDLRDHLEPLRFQKGIVHLLVGFDYGEELFGLLEPLSPRIEPAIAADVEFPLLTVDEDLSEARAARLEAIQGLVLDPGWPSRLEAGEAPGLPLPDKALLGEEPESKRRPVLDVDPPSMTAWDLF